MDHAEAAPAPVTTPAPGTHAGTSTTLQVSPRVADEAGQRAAEDTGISAALIAAGVGSATFGVLVVAAAANEAIYEALTVQQSVGSLSGKAFGAIVAWAVAWPLLHLVFSRTSVSLSRALVVAAALVAVGFLLTFPPIYLAIAGVIAG